MIFQVPTLPGYTSYPATFHPPLPPKDYLYQQYLYNFLGLLTWISDYMASIGSQVENYIKAPTFPICPQNRGGRQV